MRVRYYTKIMFNLVAHLNLICSVIGFLAGIGIIFRRKNDATFYIGIILILYSYNRFNSISILDVSSESKKILSIIVYFLTSFNGFLPCIIYMYSKSIRGKTKLFTGMNLIHIIPALLLMIYYHIFFRFRFSGLLSITKENLIYTTFFHLNPSTLWFAIILVLLLFYSVLSFISFIRYIVNSNLNNKKIRKTAVVWSIIILCLFLMNALLRNIGYWSVVANLQKPLFEANLRLTGDFIIDILIINIIFISFNKPELLNNPVIEVAPKIVKPKYEKLNINDKRVDSVIKEIENYFQNSHDYLEYTFSLNNLSKALNISNQKLSYILNTGMKCNFHQLVNSYRIKYSMKIMEKNIKNDFQDNIINIAAESGFRNKTTFNTYFKQISGMTPSEYIKIAKNSYN